MTKELMSYQVFIFAFSGIRRTHINIRTKISKTESNIGTNICLDIITKEHKRYKSLMLFCH